MAKIAVDYGLCESNGICMGIIPEVFNLDDDDELHVLSDEVTPDNAANPDFTAVKSLVDSGAYDQALPKLQELDKDSPTLSEAEKTRRQRELVELDRDLQRKHREFQEDLTQRKNEELSSVAERANRTIKAIGDAEHYDIILQDQLVIYFSNRVDLTKKVIDALNASK